MSRIAELSRHLAVSDLAVTHRTISVVSRNNGVVERPHVETEDFPFTDPWSEFFRKTISELREQGLFTDRHILEFGIGDARNIIAAGFDIKKVTGVDKDSRRLVAAEANFLTHPEYDVIPQQLIHADAVEYIDQWKREHPGEKLSAITLICLPQSPQGENSADKYDADGIHEKYRKWDKYGLTLNAAVLGELRTVAAKDMEVLIVNSDRVAQEVREEVIREAGWEIVNEYQSGKIQQDPDTLLDWMVDIDDGMRFYELRDGEFSPISVSDAIHRQKAAIASGRNREGFNVYHDLSIYRLKPAENQKSDGLVFRSV